MAAVTVGSDGGERLLPPQRLRKSEQHLLYSHKVVGTG